MKRNENYLEVAFKMFLDGNNKDDVLKYLEEQAELNKVLPVKVWREDDTVKLPKYSKEDDACMDVYIHSIEFKEDGRIIYHTGLYFELPKDYEMEIRPRSSNTKTMEIMPNSPGTLDAGYRGELMVVHRNIITPESPIPYYGLGDRVAQILIRKREKIVWNEVHNKEDLLNSDRGEGGFGSTGK